MAPMRGGLFVLQQMRGGQQESAGANACGAARLRVGAFDRGDQRMILHGAGRAVAADNNQRVEIGEAHAFQRLGEHRCARGRSDEAAFARGETHDVRLSKASSDFEGGEGAGGVEYLEAWKQHEQDLAWFCRRASLWLKRRLL